MYQRQKHDFGLSKEQSQEVETIVRTVPAEWQATLRMAIVIGIGETRPGRPFQTLANNIMAQYSAGGES
jgi:hypothetical protein